MSLPLCKKCKGQIVYLAIGVYGCEKCKDIPDEIEIQPEYFEIK